MVKCEKDVQYIDVHDEVKNSVVFTLDGVYAENAGAIFCHLIGGETDIFHLRLQEVGEEREQERKLCQVHQQVTQTFVIQLIYPGCTHRLVLKHIRCSITAP